MNRGCLKKRSSSFASARLLVSIVAVLFVGSSGTILDLYLAAAPPAAGSAVKSDTRAGADWWSLRKLTDPQPPDVLQSDWPLNAIDRFVLARLEAKKLQPSPAADRRTLLRRVTFNLIGLPPSPDELQEFLADRERDAYEKVVDRLLASPHFGERWARHWLDVVRFAESQGFERNRLRSSAWPYRDWVIQSFNEDLPYDDFVRLQLAGDMLKPDDPGIIIATGYLVAGPYDLLGSTSGTEAMQTMTRQDQLEDMVGNFGQTFLGLTIQCARCHDHKFDPVPQKEYYQMAATLGGVWPGERDTLTESPRVAVQRGHAELTERMQKYRPRLAEIEGTVRRQIEDTLRSEVVKAAEAAESKATKALEEAARKLDEAKAKAEAAHGNDKDKLAKGIEKAKEELAKKEKELDQAKAATTSARESTPRAPYGMIIDQLPEKERTEYRCLVFAVSQLEMRAQLLDVGKVDANVPKQPKPFHVLHRGDFRKIGEIVVPAGIAAVAGPRVDFGLAPDSPEGDRRAKLAEWVTDPLNPLLARVIVNRLWHYHFGIGLVDTPNDFGFNGGRPSHPELLDWLARELLRNGWSLKKLHRLIVTSATYRQASRLNNESASRRSDGPDSQRQPSQSARLVTSAATSLGDSPTGSAAIVSDAENRLLWRKSPQRLEAEAIRDAILAVCGELNPEMGGPGYRDTEAEKSGDNTTYSFAGGFSGALNRRTIYRTWIRRSNHPLLDPLDCADPSISVPRRTVTTTPLQALALLNNEFMAKAAETFAARLRREAGDNRALQVKRAYELAYSRDPTDEEIASAQRYIVEHGLGEFCLVIFNANEFVFVD